VDNAARSKPLSKLREVRRRRIVRLFRLLLSVEVVQVTEEFVEAVDRREELVAVAQVVLAELGSGVSQRLEQLRYRWVLRL
jgi:hypothetical protein